MTREWCDPAVHQKMLESPNVLASQVSPPILSTRYACLDCADDRHYDEKQTAVFCTNKA
jgi:hypothetical protein